MNAGQLALSLLYLPLLTRFDESLENFTYSPDYIKPCRFIIQSLVVIGLLYITSFSTDDTIKLYRWVENPYQDPLAGVRCNSYITVAYLGEGPTPCKDPL